MKQSKLVFYYLSILSFLYIGLIIIGLINNYSPVPYWDMWNAYLEFYIQVQNGDWTQWFAQHNEHRILLSKILFWTDIAIFEGRSYFLLITNFFLITFIIVTFALIIKKLFKEKKYQYLKKLLLLFVTIIIFSWIQKENIIWGFQSQFFLAYLVPLISFYLLGKYQETLKNSFYILALFTASISAVTMANGILTLPLLVVLGVIFKLGTMKHIVNLSVTTIVFYLYFHNYTAPVGHGSLSETLLNHTIDFFLYILTYIGAPFAYMTGKSSLLIPQAFGLFLILSSLFFTYKSFTSTLKNPMIFVLLAFLVYAGGTAFGTAGGRALFGIEQALSSRYMTPALMAWVSLLIIYMAYFKDKILISKVIMSIFVLVPLLLLPQQIKALKNNKQELFTRNIAALALELGIKDKESINHVFPFFDWALNIAKEARSQNLSIFSDTKIKDVNELIGTSIKNVPRNILSGNLDEITNIENNNIYKIRGWIYDNKQKIVPSSLLVVNNNYKIIGYIITGMPRKDVASISGENAYYSGFIGYIKGDLKNQQKISFINLTKDKAMSAQINLPPKIIKKQFVKNGTYKSEKLSGYSVFGSFITSDKDQADYNITIDKSIDILYKTGPVNINQMMRIIIDNKVIYEKILKKQRNWMKLDYNESIANKFTLQFSDEGSNWGEWSAIAIREKQ